MVGMAKRLTHRIVAPARMGSIPITHPILGRSQAVRQRVLAPSFVGSNPAAPARGRAFLPGFILYSAYIRPQADVAELADAPDLGSGEQS